MRCCFDRRVDWKQNGQGELPCCLHARRKTVGEQPKNGLLRMFSGKWLFVFLQYQQMSVAFSSSERQQRHRRDFQTSRHWIHRPLSTTDPPIREDGTGQLIEATLFFSVRSLLLVDIDAYMKRNLCWIRFSFSFLLPSLSKGYRQMTLSPVGTGESWILALM